MPDDNLRYDLMVQDALRSVVGRALNYAAKHGLTGDHHFYVTFRTDDPGARVPPRLRERYPNEMTIVLQHQFWDLEVRDHDFSVTLSFGDVPEKLTVPYTAVVAFADPSVQFGLQFDVGDTEAVAETAEDDDPDAAANHADSGPRELDGPSENVVPLDTFRKKST